MQQLQQEDWIKQQIAEKEAAKQAAASKEAERHANYMKNNALLKQAQEEHAQQRREMTVANKQANYAMAIEKRDRDQAHFHDSERRAATEVDFTLNHDFMTENPATEQSMLAPHRVKPYHFKGLNAEQQAAILHERQ